MRKLFTFLFLIISGLAFANPPGTFNPLLLANTCIPQTSNFVVVLHFDGTNGSTTFTNSAIGGSTAWTSTGAGAVLSTATFKFGTASLSTASNNYANSNNNADFGSLGTGDFAFSFWLKRGAVTGLRQNMFGMSNAGLTGGFYYGDINSSGAFTFSINDTQLVTTTAAITDTNWHNIEVNRIGSNMYIALDGTFSAATNVTGVSANASGSFSVGTLGDFGGSFFTGNTDEFVIVKGASLHSASFTPNSAPFCP